MYICIYTWQLFIDLFCLFLGLFLFIYRSLLSVYRSQGQLQREADAMNCGRALGSDWRGKLRMALSVSFNKTKETYKLDKRDLQTIVAKCAWPSRPWRWSNYL